MAIGLQNASVCQDASVKRKQNRKRSIISKEAIEGYIAVLEEDGLPIPEERFEAFVLAV